MSKTQPNRDSEGNLSCPDCGGALWDNREKKEKGTFKANSPDFTCKDKEGCGYAFWLEPKGGGGKKKAAGPKRGGGEVPDGAPLGRALAEAYSVARDVVGHLRQTGFELMADEVAIPDVANRLFRGHVDSGRPIKTPDAPAPPPAPDPPPKPTGDSTLPF